ncbi:GPP34 family phosphoprotein [Nocardioides sp. GY 10127]|uniref:GOLPH3/VPS74 family protein n=1 Tax=Nocardioides sp. GY 10127 TaxID=2569762 RepID=UPI0010A815D6|nr:GPP34 family phosphoprotein [Nocardioides sp. GY 10127]TIC80729.1 GPP34 family phosphoprotein [Nocardioides sp. GY 10127]
MTTLLADDLLLLLLDQERGTVPVSTTADLALGGAVLVDLALGEHVEAQRREGVWRTDAVRPTDAPPPTDPLLADAFRLVAEKERRPQDVVARLSKGLRPRLAERLAERGLVERVDERVLGLFPRTRWPEVDSRHEEELRRTLHEVLVDGRTPDLRTGALVALLHVADRAHRLVDAPGVSDRELRRRAKAVSEGLVEGDWAVSAASAAVAAATSAAVAATTAATVTAATAASTGGVSGGC